MKRDSGSLLTRLDYGVNFWRSVKTYVQLKCLGQTDGQMRGRDNELDGREPSNFVVVVVVVAIVAIVAIAVVSLVGCSLLQDRLLL